MSTLTDMIGYVTNLRGPESDFEKPLHWTRHRLATHLYHNCDTRDEMRLWHEEHLRWAKKSTHSIWLEQLCINVAQYLDLTISIVNILQSWASGRIQLPESSLTDRGLVILALGNLEDAFREFRVVKRNENTQKQIRELTLDYLRKVYELVLVLATPLVPEESWLEEQKKYLEVTRLENFKFDDENDYRQMRNPTLSGVIADHTSMPTRWQPAHPQPPVLIQNFGPYGPEIVLNIH